MSLKTKVVLITGASSGIGEALAYEYASRKFNLVLAARGEDKLQELKKQLIEKYDVNICCQTTDVSKEEDCKKLIESAIQKFGQIDILINNAGISMRAVFEEVDLTVLKQLMDVNFWGAVYCSKYALPYLLSSKGSVVGISSIAGFQGLPARTGYSSSKFAMHGFLNVLRIENMKKGLHVLIAAPGFTASNIRNTALNSSGEAQGESPRDEKKMMSAEEVAVKIAKAIDKRKRLLVLTLDGKLVVFLNKFFPKMIDKMVYKHIAKEINSPIK